MLCRQRFVQCLFPRDARSDRTTQYQQVANKTPAHCAPAGQEHRLHLCIYKINKITDHTAQTPAPLNRIYQQYFKPCAKYRQRSNRVYKIKEPVHKKCRHQAAYGTTWEYYLPFDQQRAAAPALNNTGTQGLL
jgi:hypothetical protein